MTKRLVEVFSAGCYACEDAVKQVKDLTCECEVAIYDLSDKARKGEYETKAKAYGIQSVPSVVINGKLLDCCNSKGFTIGMLQTEGI
ncbi:thioredoxin family protein [Planococcus lenghuensis]|uniref:Glutaredoxin n=1 Tax=Planococcus lenghuensis TaxID=2213202 RepID=A0A1Q2KUE5_9BACL|nr:thioredoxin family protein [Planococcus lenghuensis]AQQ51835.1 glutaredoxin [Planococcus lenghuensis]